MTRARRRLSGREILFVAIAVVIMTAIATSATWRLALLTGAIVGLGAIAAFRFSPHAGLLLAAAVALFAFGGLHQSPPTKATHRPHQAAAHRRGSRPRQHATAGRDASAGCPVRARR